MAKSVSKQTQVKIDEASAQLYDLFNKFLPEFGERHKYKNLENDDFDFEEVVPREWITCFSFNNNLEFDEDVQRVHNLVDLILVRKYIKPTAVAIQKSVINNNSKIIKDEEKTARMTLELINTDFAIFCVIEMLNINTDAIPRYLLVRFFGRIKEVKAYDSAEEGIKTQTLFQILKDLPRTPVIQLRAFVNNYLPRNISYIEGENSFSEEQVRMIRQIGKDFIKTLY